MEYRRPSKIAATRHLTVADRGFAPDGDNMFVNPLA
jgi:hypothetical protein